MRSNARVLSNVWWPIRVQDTPTEKALVVWLNSSLGLLTILTQRTSTEGGWVAMKKADLEELPVLGHAPPISASGSELVGPCSMDWQKLNSNGCQAWRLARPAAPLTTASPESLGLPNLTKLRDLLASEPVVSNRRL